LGKKKPHDYIESALSLSNSVGNIYLAVNMQQPLYSFPFIPLHHPKPLYIKQQASREYQNSNSKLAFIHVIQ